MVTKFVACAVLCLIFACAIAPVVLSVCKKLHASQSILHYVDKHASKEGTATMGGFIFLLTLVFALLFLFDGDTFLAFFAVAVTIAYALLGFLDDFLKVHFHHNEGLKPYQKIIGQVGIALIVAIFVYLSGQTSLWFFGAQFDIGWGVIPLVILVLVATVNSVNLTDGLDGLAGGTTLVYVVVFGVILALFGGLDNLQTSNLAMLCFGLAGGLLGFLTFNCHPAKIFMGDTGSLALGGFIAVTACLCGLELLIPLMGIVFVVSALSVILQVLHYKRTKKRIFLMAPLHHHFEQKGVNENRIVVVYIVVTVAVCLSVLAGVLATL